MMARCSHCHRDMGDYEGGWASLNGEPVCHPNAPNRPDCYYLCTIEDHHLPCDKPECVEDQITVDANRATKDMPVILFGTEYVREAWRLDSDEH